VPTDSGAPAEPVSHIDAGSRARLDRVLRVDAALGRVLGAARSATAAAGNDPAGPTTPEPVLLPSDSNDVWRIGPVVLRVCWRGDPGRFAREAAVTRALPPEFPYPEVLHTGADGDLVWQATRHVDGTPLSTLWPCLSGAERRDAVHQIGEALAALHAHRFPDDVVAALAPRPGDSSTAALIGGDIVPLPVRRAALLLEAAREEGRVDGALLDKAAARLRELADADPLSGDAAPLCGADALLAERPVGTAVVVHGDAHLGNALWHDGQLTALLDFEWVRLGPPDLEIEPYLRADATGLSDLERRQVLGWLAESYPAMFDRPDLARRLRLYQLATAVRDLFLDDAAPDFLRRIVESPLTA
jgi:aminoglycoside phosphotransferase (APT) family kinase protein